MDKEINLFQANVCIPPEIVFLTFSECTEKEHSLKID